MIISRLILGVGVGGAAVIGPLYIAELAPTRLRGRAVGTCAFFIPFGQVVASALGAIFQAAVPFHIGWRLLCEYHVPSLLTISRSWCCAFDRTSRSLALATGVTPSTHGSGQGR